MYREMEEYIANLVILTCHFAIRFLTLPQYHSLHSIFLTSPSLCIFLSKRGCAYAERYAHQLHLYLTPLAALRFTSRLLTFLNVAHPPLRPGLDVRRWLFWQQASTPGRLTFRYTQHFQPLIPIIPAQVMVTAGVTNAIELTAWSLGDPEDGVLLGRPFYRAFVGDMRVRVE